ncbi:abortive infection family protein [Enterococcus casseliflavus]|uniref:abortive infection family protein n=1 Tax=Enterococcus casseliflavus TaxID=37734 RepID=UPI0018836753|nr:abortive infection family protein [Enterococcus casseliflavus]MBE9908979.1 abortive infection family protein [Enterococcus casseliflavus]
MRGAISMFTDYQFKSLLIKTFERKTSSTSDGLSNHLVAKMKLADVRLDETADYTYYKGYNMGWNTLCTYLKLKVPFDDLDYFESQKTLITQVARSIYDKQGDNVLVDVIIVPLPENHIIIDFEQIKISDVVVQAVEDAESFMSSGEYQRAFDRVHTAFHGYLIEILKKYGIMASKDENLSKLYSRVQTLIETEIHPVEIADLVKTTIRSSNGMINSLNEVRNRHSLAHPNTSIIGKREAKLIIGIASTVTDYISGYLDK